MTTGTDKLPSVSPFKIFGCSTESEIKRTCDIAMNLLLTTRENCATRCWDKHFRRLHHCTSDCTRGSCSRAPATPLPSQASPAQMTTPVFHLPPTLDFFSPSVRKSARYPAWKFRRGFSVSQHLVAPLCRPRLTTLMLFNANNSKSSEADTVDCSVFSLAQCHATAKVLNDEAEIDVKMAEIRSGEECDRASA